MDIEIMDEIFCQCAEECAELAQACLKMRRVLHGTTKVDKVTVQRSLSEELGDVLNCIEAILENDPAEIDMVQKAVKMYEFKKRLRNIQEEEK